MPDPVSARENLGIADRSLVIKSGAGADDAERCVQAFTVAATALSMGVPVSMWLMGDAVRLAVPGVAATVDLEGAAALSELLDTVLEAGSLTVCTQCAARRGLTAAQLIEGARIAGAASYVEEILAPGVQALIY